VASTKTRLLGQLQSMLAAGRGSKLLDGQLLEQFTTERDQAAFATLVRRHGPMVLNVCRRVLHNAADADDAFQATFLVLARKASAIGKREALGAWLHKVAFRVALRARATVARRQEHEQRATGRFGEDPLAAITGRELLTVLDEELQALPARSRAPLILCYLEEQTREEAARHLGLTLATLKRRLEHGRAQLRRRLERRGLALAAAFLTLDSFQTTAKAAFPTLLAANTTKAAMQAAAGKGVGEVASAQIAMLVNGTLRAMALGKAVVASTLLVTVTLVGIGIGFAALQGGGAPKNDHSEPRSPVVPADREPQRPAEKKPAAPAEDLPAGAWARLGNARFANLGQVHAVAYSPDCRLLASGAWDGSIRIWETSTAQEILCLQMADGGVNKLAFSPDGKLLAAAGRHYGLSLWGIASGRLVRKMKPFKGYTDVVFSPDGQKLAGVSHGWRENSIHVWDDSGKELWSEGGASFSECAFRGPNTLIYTIHVRSKNPPPYWRLHLKSQSFGPQKDTTIQEVKGTPYLSADSSLVAVFTPGKVQYLPVRGISPGPPIHLEVDESSYPDFCFSPDRRMLAISQATRQGCQISIWEVRTGRQRCHFECADRASPALAFSRDCRTLASGSLDVTVLLWDLTGRRRPHSALAPGDLEKAWNDLLSPDAEAAFRALWRLASAPAPATAFLAEKLPPAAAPRNDIAGLVRDLANKRFSVRQQATAELMKLEDLARPALQQALGANLDLETRRRIEQLLAQLDRLSPENLRAVRAVEALERMGTRQAHDLLRKLAQGAPIARLTRDAAEASQRLDTAK
jgi:RNA polymerase sigma factor (sigma-70 family)